MKHFHKKILSVLLTGAMVVSSVQAVWAASDDIRGHWAEKVITEWQEKGMITGYNDGTFKPDNHITRAEFATLLNRAMGFEKTGGIDFSDVKIGDWYYDAVAKAAAAGYTKGYDDNTFRPARTITRAEAAVMTANAAGLTAKASGTAGFTDAANIPAWAKGSIGAASEAGFLSGYPDGSFGAAASITRAEAVSVLNRVMQGGSAKEAAVVITEDDTVLEAQVIKGDLVIDEAVGEGEVYLKDIEIEGDLIVKGGGKHSVYLDNVKVLGKMLVSKHGVHINMGGSTNVAQVEMEAAASLTSAEDFTGTIETITITQAVDSDITVEISITAEKVVVEGKVTVEIKADVKVVEVKEEAAGTQIVVAEDVKVETVTADAETAVTGSGEVGTLEANADNITVSESVAVEKTETAPSVSEPTKTEPTESNTPQETPADTPSGGSSSGGGSNKKAAKDALDVIEIDLSASDEWVTDGYLYELFDITFNGAKWVAEDLEWSDIEFRIDGEKFEWIEDVTVPGDFELEADIMGYSYDWDTQKGAAEGLVALYVPHKNVQAGNSYKVELEFPSSYLRATSGYVIKGDRFVVDFTVDIIDSEAELPAVEDTLDTIPLNIAEADDWRTDGYVYTEFEVPLKGGKWIGEPSWEKHVSFWVNGEPFIWDWETSQPGDYPLEVDMVTEWDDTGNMTVKAMVFAYVDEVEDGDVYDVEIRIPTYMMKANEGYRLTRAESGVIDFTVTIDGKGDYVRPIVDEIDDIYIDLSASDEWKTDGYLYELFDITFDGAYWSAEQEDYDAAWEAGEIKFYVDGEEFQWIEGESNVGDYAVEVDVMGYSYDYSINEGLMQGLVCAYTDNVWEGGSYEVRMEFPSYLLTDNSDDRDFKDNKAVVVFVVKIIDSHEEVTPAKDELGTVVFNLDEAEAFEWDEAYLYQTYEIPLEGADWCMGAALAHITPYVNGEMLDIGFDYENGVPIPCEGADVEIMIAEDWNDSDEYIMNAWVFVKQDAVEAGEIFDAELHIPTYMMQAWDGYRLTREESGVVDFTIKITDSDYRMPVEDLIDEIEIDLSTSDEWKTDGYLYELFDIEFDGAEWAAEQEVFDAAYGAGAIEFRIDGEKFQWGEDDKPGDYEVETDIMGYSYDGETGWAQGLVCAYLPHENMRVGNSYAVEIEFPADLLRAEEGYSIEGETVTVAFDLNIVDCGEYVPAAYDTLETVTFDLADANEDGNVAQDVVIELKGADWVMGANPAHVTPNSEGAVSIELYEDDTNGFEIGASISVNKDEVTVGDSYDTTINIPTYMMQAWDGYRLTRAKSGVIDFIITIVDSTPETEPSITGAKIFLDDEEVTQLTATDDEFTLKIKLDQKDCENSAVLVALLDGDVVDYSGVSAVIDGDQAVAEITQILESGKSYYVWYKISDDSWYKMDNPVLQIK